MQQDPDDYDSIVKASDGLLLKLEDDMPAPVRVAPNHREDPMLL